jgi:hypothetical protein
VLKQQPCLVTLDGHTVPKCIYSAMPSIVNVM